MAPLEIPLYHEFIARPNLSERKTKHMSIYFLPPQVGRINKAG